jgi:hypothetical protein
VICRLIRFLDYAGITESLKPRLFSTYKDETKSKLVGEDNSFWTISLSELDEEAPIVADLASATFFNARQNSSSFSEFLL